MWLDLEDIMLSEISRYRNLKKKQQKKNTKKTRTMYSNLYAESKQLNT